MALVVGFYYCFDACLFAKSEESVLNSSVEYFNDFRLTALAESEGHLQRLYIIQFWQTVWGLGIEFKGEESDEQLPEVGNDGFNIMGKLLFSVRVLAGEGLGQRITSALQQELFVPTQHQLQNFRNVSEGCQKTNVQDIGEFVTVAQQACMQQQMDSSPQETPQIKSETPHKHALERYEFKQTLGKGTFGKVKAAVHLPTSEMVAVKIIDKSTIRDEDDRQRVNRQVEILRTVRHPNIIQLYQIIEADDFIYLVTEYVEQGQLFKLMSDEVRLSERAAGRIFIQIMNAVEYLHRLGIAHRDLKPENILMDVDYNIKLVDFGLSNFCQKELLLETACGSPCYAPPQMVSGNNYDGKVGDLWSMGIIFYGMICGSLPFEEQTTKQLYKKVIEGFYVIPSDISLEAIEVIRKILITDPQKRITIPQLRELTFFKNLSHIEHQIIGIIVGFHPMPIDNEILDKMAEIVSFSRAQAEKQIKENRQTPLATLYYLLQKKSLREGKKTVIDLQLFLQTHEKYKQEYGILPEDEETQMKTPLKKSEKPEAKGYRLQNRKGLSKQRKQPLSIIKNKSQQQQNQPLSARKSEKAFDKNKTLNLNTLRTNRLHTTSEEKKSGRGKNSQQNSGSESNKKRKRSKLKTQHNLALNLWDAYFQKPFENTAKKPTIGTGKKVKVKEQQAQKQFQDNLKKLKEGFLKLPKMKRDERASTSKSTARKRAD